MTKPIGTNAKLAVSCNLCNERKLVAAYPDLNHARECEINQFLENVKTKSLKRLNMNEDLSVLLSSPHGLPFEEYKYVLGGNLEYLHAVYAPEWVQEGINMYDNMGVMDLTLAEFLQGLMP